MTTQGEAAITADREEVKYLIAPPEQRALVAVLNERLPSHRHRGEGANRLPGPVHFVTTVYFDTPSLAHFRAAQQDREQHVKLRAKEYYDVHPSLAELATDANQVLHQSPFVWLELKRRSGSRSQKQRVRVERRVLSAWLSGQTQPEGAGTSGESAAIQAYCASLPEPLEACSVVNYRRSSWQSPDDSLRVTIDAELAFFAPAPGLWSKPSLSRSALGQPRRREPNLLVEVKGQSSQLPPWLERALHGARAQPALYSKFVRAMESVYVHG